jgi:hypothetical protein
MGETTHGALPRLRGRRGRHRGALPRFLRRPAEPDYGGQVRGRGWKGQMGDAAVIAERPPSDIVTTTAHGDQQFIVAREVHSSDNISGSGTSCDYERALIHAGIPDFRRFLIFKIGRLDHLSSKCGVKLFDLVVAS